MASPGLTRQLGLMLIPQVNTKVVLPFDPIISLVFASPDRAIIAHLDMLDLMVAG